MAEERAAPPPVEKAAGGSLGRLIEPMAVLSHLLSLPVLAAGVWLMLMRDASCTYLLRMPQMRVLLGVALLVVFVLSNIVALYGPRLLPLPAFMAVVVPLMLLLTVGLSLVGTLKGGVAASPAWFRNRVNDGGTWAAIKGCIYDSGTCMELGMRTVDLPFYDFNLKQLSPIEGGCCKPPGICGMEYVNATYWNYPANAPQGRRNSINHFYGDCNSWSNEDDRLCYDCRSCKVGFVNTLQKQYKGTGIFLVLMSILISVAHILHFVVGMLARCSQ